MTERKKTIKCIADTSFFTLTYYIIIRDAEGVVPYRVCAVGVEIANKKAPLAESF